MMSHYRRGGGLTQQQGWVIILLLLFIIVLGLNGGSLESIEERWDTMQEEREPRVISKEEGAAWATALLLALFWLGVSAIMLTRYKATVKFLSAIECAWRDPRVPLVVTPAFWVGAELLYWLADPGELTVLVINLLIICICVAVFDNVVWCHKRPIAAWFNRVDKMIAARGGS